MQERNSERVNFRFSLIASPQMFFYTAFYGSDTSHSKRTDHILMLEKSANPSQYKCGVHRKIAYFLSFPETKIENSST